jgi:hypothetical protein
MQPERDDTPEMPAAAIVAINQGKVIEAIRIVREAAPGLGLKDAKERVEAYVARDPMLKSQHEQRRRLARGKLIKAVLIIDVLLAAAIIWYFFGR